MAFWMDSPGPTTELCAATEPTPTASATPLATNRVRAMVANNSTVRLIKRPPLFRGAKEERCQTAVPLRNESIISLGAGDVCALWHKNMPGHKWSPELRRIHLPETVWKLRGEHDVCLRSALWRARDTPRICPMKNGVASALIFPNPPEKGATGFMACGRSSTPSSTC